MGGKMFKLKPTNKCTVIVEPKGAGDFGFCSISTIERSPKEEHELCEDIQRDIKRHIDNVSYVSIDQKQVYEDEDGNEFDTLYEALASHYDEYNTTPHYNFEYKRPSDNGVGTLSSVNNFQELIEEAYRQPWSYNLTFAYPTLDEGQIEFLSKVIEAGLKDKSK
jgi:hypothetical protein